METGLQSEDLKFFQELIGKKVYIHLKSRQGEAIRDTYKYQVQYPQPFVIISIGKKFIKARSDINNMTEDIIILNIDDIAYIYEYDGFHK